MRGKKDNGVQVRVDGMRLSFNDLFTPFVGKKDDGTPAKPVFTAQLLTPKGSPQYQQISQAIQRVAKAEWGDNAAAVLKALIPEKRVCFRDGNTKLTDDGAVREGYEGQYFLAGRSYVKPTVLDADRSVLTADSGKPYSGCYVNAVVRIWPQSGEFGKRINCQLMGVQFAKDGESFGGSRRPADVADFDSLAEFASGDDDLMGDSGTDDDIPF